MLGTECEDMLRTAMCDEAPEGPNTITCCCRHAFTAEMAFEIHQQRAPRNAVHVLMPDNMSTMAGHGIVNDMTSNQVLTAGTVAIPNMGERNVSSTRAEVHTMNTIAAHAVNHLWEKGTPVHCHLDNKATVNGEAARHAQTSHRREQKSTTGTPGRHLHKLMQHVKDSGGAAAVHHMLARHGREGSTAPQRMDDDNNSTDHASKGKTAAMLLEPPQHCFAGQLMMEAPALRAFATACTSEHEEDS